MIERTISQYRLLEQLGRGGMGEVYLAEDTRVGHRVAIKLLPRHLSEDAAAKTRFLREARAVAQLDHPCILPLHEFDEHEGELYFVTAYLSGGSMRDALKRAGGEPIPLETSLRWAVQAAEGLAAAHRRGVIHRDIKPDNLLLTEDGDLRICDFGLASIADATRITHSGMTMGTLGYMSPEQVRGQAVDRCTDLFSLGATLYELLTGRPPFSGHDQAAALHAIAYDEVTPLLEHRPDLPTELATLVEDMLRKDPSKRLCSAGHAAERLRAVASAVGAAQTLSLPSRTGEVADGKWRPLVWAGLALLVVIAGGWLAWDLLHGEPEPSRTSEVALDARAPEGEGVVRFAVLPFSVQGAGSVQGLADGIVELMSTRLQDAGVLRRLDAGNAAFDGRDVDGVWDWSADLASARKLASQRGIDLLVRGAVVEAAGQLHVSAEMHETTTTSGPLAKATVEGSLADLHRLLDDLSIEILLDRVEQTQELPFGVDSIRTRSLSALKYYLTGESVAGNWASIAQYEKAVEEDSTLAMAWFRMAQHYLPPMTTYDPARDAIRRALELSEQFTPDALRHVRAVEAFIDGDLPRVEEICRGIISNEPDNAEAWSLLAGAYRLFSWKQGIRITEARPVVERLAELREGVRWQLSSMDRIESGVEARE